MQTLLAFINDPTVDPVVSAGCLPAMKPIDFGQHGAADAAKVLNYPELDISDLFVSTGSRPMDTCFRWPTHEALRATRL